MRTILKLLLNLLHHCFYFMFWFFDWEACGIFTPWPRVEPISPALEGETLTTWTHQGSPRNKFFLLLISHYWRKEDSVCSCVCVSDWVTSVVSDSLWPCGLHPPGSSSVGFSRQGSWSGLTFPSPGDLPNPGICRWVLYPWATWESPIHMYVHLHIRECIYL